ncbi:LOW QUALITY PROTEIN: hypothetical protein PHMEG_00025841 [Phytophthora megakarya]|uniref:Uncharacterized protein n=1 Tax=Phytophthora megakarya TaxID=4795 RepID=A0A225VBW4_9STRA|nr:LOW QUALITY PROTEIN: hypothetical protein PHMEG_00025841 [Phytophthora megakarya]
MLVPYVTTVTAAKNLQLMSAEKLKNTTWTEHYQYLTYVTRRSGCSVLHVLQSLCKSAPLHLQTAMMTRLNSQRPDYLQQATEWTNTRGLVEAKVHKGETDPHGLAAMKEHETDTRGLVAMKKDEADARGLYGLITHEGDINTETHGLIAKKNALESEINRALVHEGESDHRRLHKNEEGESDYRDLNGTKENCIQGSAMTNRYGRLFTKTELDKLEQGVYGDAGEGAEGYDKVLEERLYPLDEVELQRRIKANAEARRAPSLEELSVTLGIPVTTLEKTKDGRALDAGILDCVVFADAS